MKLTLTTDDGVQLDEVKVTWKGWLAACSDIYVGHDLLRGLDSGFNPDDEPLICIRCGSNAGKDYHLIGGSSSRVTCDGCWDERLR